MAKGRGFASQQRLLELWTREFTPQGHLLPCYWTLLIEATTLTTGHEMILKPETAILSRMMSEKHSNKGGSAQKRNIIK